MGINLHGRRNLNTMDIRWIPIWFPWISIEMGMCFPAPSGLMIRISKFFFKISWTSPEMPGDCIAKTSWLANGSEWVNLKTVPGSLRKNKSLSQHDQHDPNKETLGFHQFHPIPSFAIWHRPEWGGKIDSFNMFQQFCTGNSPIFPHVDMFFSFPGVNSKSCHLVSLKIPCFRVNSM